MVGECVERSRRSGVCRSFALVVHASSRVGLFGGRLNGVLNYNVVDGKPRGSKELDHRLGRWCAALWLGWLLWLFRFESRSTG